MALIGPPETRKLLSQQWIRQLQHPYRELERIADTHSIHCMMAELHAFGNPR